MGKANRPLVIRIKPGDSKESALARSLAKPNAAKRKGKILIRLEAK